MYGGCAWFPLIVVIKIELRRKFYACEPGSTTNIGACLLQRHVSQ
jgi:hypothetical protein